jgi:hypothetical protein
MDINHFQLQQKESLPHAVTLFFINKLNHSPCKLYTNILDAWDGIAFMVCACIE